MLVSLSEEIVGLSEPRSSFLVAACVAVLGEEELACKIACAPPGVVG